MPPFPFLSDSRPPTSGPPSSAVDAALPITSDVPARGYVSWRSAGYTSTTTPRAVMSNLSSVSKASPWSFLGTRLLVHVSAVRLRLSLACDDDGTIKSTFESHCGAHNAFSHEIVKSSAAAL